MMIKSRLGRNIACWIGLVGLVSALPACSGNPEIVSPPDGGWLPDGGEPDADAAVAPDAADAGEDTGIIQSPDAGDSGPDAGPCAQIQCGERQHCAIGDDGGASCAFDTCADLACSGTETCVEGQPGVSGAYCKDLSCTTDLQCDQAQYCNGTICVDDVCKQDSSHCDGQKVISCAPNGGSEQTVFTCGSAAYFDSTCTALTPTSAVCPCEDDWDCPAHTICDVDTCVGTGQKPTCSLPPEPFKNVLPTNEIQWGGKDLSHRDAVGSPFPKSSQTVMSPVVANLNDDNGDGLINERDFPEIIFTTFCNSEFTTNGVVRAIHGGGPNKGKDFFAVSGNTVWHEGDPTNVAYTCSGADINSTASLAVGDLDGDGKPEIVAMHEQSNAGIVIYANNGDIISKSPALNMGYNDPGPTIANLDNKGFAEIIVGRYVYTLTKDAQGKLQILDKFKGTGTNGSQGQGPVTCVANLVGDSQQEIVAASTVYRLPKPPAGVTKRADCKGPYTNPDATAFCAGRLITVWNGAQVNGSALGSSHREGFCAVADVLGADQDAAPGPNNPLDGKAEVIVISNGFLVVFNGQTGKLRRYINLHAGSRGGPPNVDDFDGDGFPEIGSAFAAQYVMMDLQATTAACPDWPHVFDDKYTGSDPLQGNPPRNGPCQYNGWRRKTEDNSSSVTGSSVFDFNGDGAAEVIYNDECYFRIYDGTNGQVLFKEHSPSRTRIEYPIVADVDNDGNAEIVFATSNESGFCSEGNNYNNGLEVWGDAKDTWVSARRIWNEHAYHVTNVLESGGVPVKEPESWLPYQGRIYNTYRSNPRSFGVAPDLTVAGVQLSSPDAVCGKLSKKLDIAVLIENKGDLRVGPGVVVAFYGQWDSPTLSEPLHADAQQTPLTVVLQTSLEPKDSTIVTAHYDAANNSPGELPARVRVVVDDTGLERECDESNNEKTTKVEAGQPMPDLTIDLGLVSAGACPSPTVHTVVTNAGSAPASNVLVRYFAGDPDQGGKIIHDKLIPGPIAPGASETFDEALTGFPPNLSVLVYGWVDPDNTIAECNDGNNIDEADNKVICGVVH